MLTGWTKYLVKMTDSVFVTFRLLFMVSGGRNKTFASTAASGRGPSDVVNTEICFVFYQTWFLSSDSRRYSGFIWWDLRVPLLVIVLVAGVGRGGAGWGGYLHHCVWKSTSTTWTTLECMYLSNTTIFDGRNMYRNIQHKEQLHASALDSGHLQVVK